MHHNNKQSENSNSNSVWELADGEVDGGRK